MSEHLSQIQGPFHLDYDQHLEPYVDGKANDIDREIVDSHVALCSQCAEELRDLLAFKQQPLTAIVRDERVTSSRRKQWLPQWRLLSNPAWATAAVVGAVLILAMAVLLWTTKSDKQRQAAENEPPAPAPTAQTVHQPTPSNQSQQNQADLPTPPREEPLIALNDAGGQVALDQRGHLEGLEDLPPDLRESVERVLAARRLRASPALTGWPTGAANLRSEIERQSTFAPLDPTDVVIETDRPTFRWRALDGAQHYVVTLYDAKLRLVGGSGPVTGTEWTTPSSLERGVVYSWQIRALKDGETFVSPKPPLPEARFKVLDQRAATVLGRLKESASSSHLAMGVFYWKHGLNEEAEREFQALAKANPNSTVAKELLKSLQAATKRHKN